jgi:hypothetical protein
VRRSWAAAGVLGPEWGSGQMAEKSGKSPVGKYHGAPIGGALTALLTWVTADDGLLGAGWSLELLLIP